MQSLGDTPYFTGTDELPTLKHIINAVPTAVSRFVNDEGKVAYIIVNLSQTEPTKIQPTFTGALAVKGNNAAFWKCAYSPKRGECKEKDPLWELN